MGPAPRPYPGGGGPGDSTRCPYCQGFFPTRDIEAHKATCSDRPDGR